MKCKLCNHSLITDNSSERYDPEDIRNNMLCPNCGAKYGVTKANIYLLKPQPAEPVTQTGPHPSESGGCILPASQSASEPDVWLTEDDVKGKTAFVDTSSGKSLTHIKLSEVLNAKYGPPSDHIGKAALDELLAIMDVEREEWKDQLAAKDELLREVLSVAYQTKEINRHPMLCLKEIRGMIEAKLEGSR